MSKIKVLVVPSDRTGVSHFRSTKPHIALERNYPEEFHVDIDYEPKIYDDEWLKQYDIIHYHRQFGPFEQTEELLKRCDDLGIVTIMDLDDHWAPGAHHPAYLMIKENQLDKKIMSNVKCARNITTTTSLFADEMKKLNKNIYVLANAIDPTDKQYTPNPEPSDRVRIGWLGGSSHQKDLELVKSLAGQIKGDGLIDKVQFVLCGYDLRGMLTIIDERTGQKRQRPIKPKESVWFKYEQIFTDNYNIVSEDYKKWLLEFKKGEYEGVEDEPYRRVWTKPITTYAKNYNLFDISLAPIEENTFNKVKSQLKVIEAGFHKKAIVAQDFGPYKIDINNFYQKPKKGEHTPIVDPNGNGILIRSARNHKDWYKNLKRLILNPELITEMGERLYDTVKDTYSMDAVTTERRDLYKKLIEDNKTA